MKRLEKKFALVFFMALAFFLMWGWAYGNDGWTSPENKSSHEETSLTAGRTMAKTSQPDGLAFFKNHLNKGMTQTDVVRLFGKDYKESVTEQAGEKCWTYYFSKDPNYQPSAPPYEVDQESLKSGKLQYQLSIVWDGREIKSYILFYHDNGRIKELKEKFFAGPYPNE